MTNLDKFIKRKKEIKFTLQGKDYIVPLTIETMVFIEKANSEGETDAEKSIKALKFIFGDEAFKELDDLLEPSALLNILVEILKGMGITSENTKEDDLNSPS